MLNLKNCWYCVISFFRSFRSMDKFRNLSEVFPKRCHSTNASGLCKVGTGWRMADGGWKNARRRGGYSQTNWVGVCGPLPKSLTLFMTKICDIPYPIYDLTKNLKPCLSPELASKSCFRPALWLVPQLRLMSSYLWRAFVDFLFDNDEKVAFS